MKNIILLALILHLSLSQTCTEWSGSTCVKCQSGWTAYQGKCINDEDDPCPGKNQCGQAKSFNSISEFSKFVDANPNPNQNFAKGGAVLESTNNFATAQASSNDRVASAAPSAARSAAPAAAPASSGSGAAARDFSQTNNQVSSVDEADILKTDGTYIYTISGTSVKIVRAFPYINAGVVATLNFKDAPQGLFIEGKNLAIFGTSYTYFPCYDYYPIDPIFPRQPVLLDSFSTGGAVAADNAARRLQATSISSKRLIRPPVRCQPPENKVFVYIYSLVDLARGRYPSLINNFQFEGYYQNGRKYDGHIYLISNVYFYDRAYNLPFYTNNGARVSINPQNVFFFSPRYQWPLFVNIFAFNLRAPTRSSFNIISLITQNSGNIYMSPTNLYLTYTKWNWQTNIFSQETIIHKIYINKLRMVPFADGVVKGYINNQFFMDEYNKFFRVATTVNSGGTTSNNIYCLNRYLIQIGAYEGFAPTQTIFAVRFVGTKVYVVTFRIVDPFYVFDLANHYNPILAGELKIPGFSRYLHPYDENTIIGIGRQADANGRQQGLKISLFDVSNINSPQELASYELQQQYVSSSAEWEHKAFLFERSKNLMVIPASYYNYNDQSRSFNGAFVFNIQRNYVHLSGLIDHVQGNFDRFWERAVQRSLYIEDLLYTKSSCLIRINTLAHLNGVRNIQLCQGNQRQDQLSGIPVF